MLSGWLLDEKSLSYFLVNSRRKNGNKSSYCGFIPSVRLYHIDLRCVWFMRGIEYPRNSKMKSLEFEKA